MRYQQQRRGARPDASGTGRAALGAAAVMLALTFWGRGLAFALAAALVGPVPALRTALQALAPAADAPAAPAASAASAAAPAPTEADPAGTPPAAGGIEPYLVELLPDTARPADAGAVAETFYGHGSGENYIACAAGTIRNNTRVPSAEVAAEAAGPLPFDI